jgi:hypothetical protein
VELLAEDLVVEVDLALLVADVRRLKLGPG